MGDITSIEEIIKKRAISHSVPPWFKASGSSDRVTRYNFDIISGLGIFSWGGSTLRISRVGNKEHPRWNIDWSECDGAKDCPITKVDLCTGQFLNAFGIIKLSQPRKYFCEDVNFDHGFTRSGNYLCFPDRDSSTYHVPIEITVPLALAVYILAGQPALSS